MIKSRNMDPEAGKWSEPIKLASSTTAAFSFANPTGNEILVDMVVINVTTAAASKSIYVGVNTSATGGSGYDEIMSAADLTSGLTTVSTELTTVAKGSYVVGGLNATDSTLVAHAYIHYKELTK